MELLPLIAFGTSAPAANYILLIIADDYGADASSLYNTAPGAQLPQTPNIASLATNGIKFSNAYAYPLCSPARSSILTGRQGFRTPIMWSHGAGSEIMKPLATPVLGGMVSSLLHILIVTPVIFVWLRARDLANEERAKPLA